ncbi:PrsW family intramembrane metalloprotease, partial [Staphylococcus aureus]
QRLNIETEGQNQKFVSDVSHIDFNAQYSQSLEQEIYFVTDRATKSIGRLAGNDESLNLNLKDMLSEVFKPHTKNEADEIFIAG